MSAKRLMVQGTASSVGKSLLVAALCRIFARRGLRVAPFKSQNMALNSFITAQGLEMGRAQVTQAEAAGIAPNALMNPILLKPTTDRKSQVIVNGQVRATMSAQEYYACRHQFRDDVRAAFETLADQYDLIIIEGAGSPAEINLRENDLANMGMAALADAPVLLVGDIDRGGVFASLYGTVALLEPEEQARIKGFVVNKFRGDPAILEPGLRQLEALLHRPVLGVLPHWDLAIDEEDSLTERFSQARDKEATLDVAVLRLPRLSNFTDFAVFDIQPDVSLRYVTSGQDLGRPDLLILPGSKSTIADMLWLRQSGLETQILRLHSAGCIIAGICGGFQMLGRRILDPLGTESSLPEIMGLGLLDMETLFEPQKATMQTKAVMRSAPGPLAPAQNIVLQGYEIHMGRSTPGPGLTPLLSLLPDNRPEGGVNEDGSVFGTYLHGIFDSLEFTRALLDALRARKGIAALKMDDAPANYAAFKEREYDRLGDIVENNLDMKTLEAIIGGK